jgi:hypothetical protein
MHDHKVTLVSRILKWTAIGSFCGPAAAILSAVIVFSRANPGDDPERDGELAFFLVAAFAVLLIPVGAILGAIVGTILAFIRRRRNQWNRLRIDAGKD